MRIKGEKEESVFTSVAGISIRLVSLSRFFAKSASGPAASTKSGSRWASLTGVHSKTY